jgi:HK97 family phage prohead protease
MPNPDEFDKEDEFMSACVSTAISEGKDQDQAVAMCAAMWADKGKKTKPTPEFKSFPLSVQGVEGRTVKSLFAVMGYIDDGGDRIHPKAFTKTLQEHVKRVQVLWQHDASQPPVGKPLVIKEVASADLPGEYKAQYPTATGALYGEVEYLDTPRGNEILTGIRAGAIKENSIGYDTLQYDYSNEKERKIRNLREVRLWDISPVNWGMQPAAINFKEAMVKFHMGELDIPGMIPEILRVFTGESKEGRVLSARNLEKLKQALETLNQLLFAAEPPQNDEFVKAFTQQLRLRIAIAEKELY